MDKHVNRICDNCGESFRVYKCAIKDDSPRRFCSRRCFGIDRTEKSNIHFRCLNCGKNDMVKMSQRVHYKGGGKFCTRRCHFEFLRKCPEKNPQFKPEGFIDSHGYRVILGKREHRIIMERVLGRRLLTKEHVHHKNGIKTDNRIENLEVLTESEHHALHGHDKSPEGLKAISKRTRARWVAWRKDHWSELHNECVKCGLRTHKHQGNGFCTKCYLKNYGMAHAK